MQDDVKAVERELRAYLDHPRRQVETLYESHPTVLIRKAADTLAALQQRCERLEQAARAALPWVTGEEEATALEAALAPEHSGGYSMAPEDTDPKLAGLCGPDRVSVHECSG